MHAESPTSPLRYTFRVDASFDLRSRIAGIGVVLSESKRRRRDGPSIATFSEAYRDVPPGLCEKLAILRALEIGRDRGLSKVKIRSDYNAMRRELKRDYESGSCQNREDLHGRILRLAREFDRVVFSWLPRRKNQQAHGLARRAVASEVPLTRSDIQWLHRS
ncbi:MAG: ribonuclease H-like domain-containing protein [Deltaproteobacteria bacterium]|nr:ribonuclease H-like domain-containing protein [Deltaproteobacteria bacterium]